MANTTFQIKRSIVPGKLPGSSDLQIGELAINLTDARIFSKHTLGDIVTLSDYNLSNSAHINAGNAFNKANVATTNAGNAFNQANTALSAAQFAYNLANSAYNLAQTSGGGSGGGSISAYLETEEFISSEDQSTFIITGGYQIGKLSVHLNGVLLSSDEYDASNGVSITFSESLNSGDIVSISKWKSDVIFASNTSTFSTGTSEEVIDSYNIETYTSTKYFCQITYESSIHCSEILLTHDGTFAYLTEYAVVKSDISLGVYNADVTGGFVRLLFTPIDTDVTVKFKRLSI